VLILYSFFFSSIHSLGGNGISINQKEAVQDAIKHIPTPAEAIAARLVREKAMVKTLVLPLQTLAGERYLVHSWGEAEDVRAVAASQHPVLGLFGPDVVVHGTALEASDPHCCGWTSEREVATITTTRVYTTPWRMLPPGSSTPLPSCRADTVLEVLEERIAAGEATDMPWTVVWDAAEPALQASARQVQPTRQMTPV
jgi:hypothetical protein